MNRVVRRNKLCKNRVARRKNQENAVCITCVLLVSLVPDATIKLFSSCH